MTPIATLRDTRGRLVLVYDGGTVANGCRYPGETLAELLQVTSTGASTLRLFQREPREGLRFREDWRVPYVWRRLPVGASHA